MAPNHRAAPRSEQRAVSPVRPAIVIHADWGSRRAARWKAIAGRNADGYYALAPEPVGAPGRLIPDIAVALGAGESGLVGFDFPIGLPHGYAERVGAENFLAFLRNLGRGGWQDFYDVAALPGEVSPIRPFYPLRPGAAKQEHLLAGLGVTGRDKLLRLCERGSPERPEASPLFWTLGGKQVGKGAIVGWRDVLAPAIADEALDIVVWPFDGPLATLFRPGRVVVAEPDPAEFYRHLGINFGGRKKRERSARRANAGALIAWATRAGVAIRAELREQIESGFENDDAFDAVVGLFGMLNVVLGHRPSGEPDDDVVRRIEGWMLGQDGSQTMPATHEGERPRTRDELARTLAEVSHATWMRQANRDKGVPLEKLSAEVAEHDLERAEDTVRELERLRIVRFPVDS
jgi:hypothetical protein